MPNTGNYSLGKIYKLVSNQTDKIYIGSTCQQYLSSRLGGHRAQYKLWLNQKHNFTTSFDLIKYDDCQIVLIENFPCVDKYELEARERYHIENNHCVNRMIPTRTRHEYYEQNKVRFCEMGKLYRQDNADKKKERDKKYRMENKERLADFKKQYYKINKEAISERRKQRYQEQQELKEKNRLRAREYQNRNKEIIAEKCKEQIVCEVCGSRMRKYELRRHKKTKKCQSHLSITT